MTNNNTDAKVLNKMALLNPICSHHAHKYSNNNQKCKLKNNNSHKNHANNSDNLRNNLNVPYNKAK